MMSVPDLTIYLAETEGEVIGTAATILMPHITYGCVPTLFIEAVSVLPGFRRQGIASALIRRALEEGRVAGCNKVQLLSHKRHRENP